MDIQVNWLAVLLAAVASMVIGTVWYSKSVFGKMWMKLTKQNEEKMKGRAPVSIAVAFISSLLMAYVLAHVTYLSASFFNETFMTSALTTGAWMWLGFQAFRGYMHDSFEGRSGNLTLINAGNDFVTIMVMAVIIGLFKV